MKDNRVNNSMQKESIQLGTYRKKLCTKQVTKVKAANNLIYGNLTKKILSLYTSKQRSNR